jgi:hypothetical protein
MEKGTMVKRRKVEEPTLMEEQTQFDVDKTFEMHLDLTEKHKRNIMLQNFITFFDLKLQAYLSQQTRISLSVISYP